MLHEIALCTARDLGVVIDSSLTMSDHVTAVCRSAYYTSCVSYE